MFQFIDSNNFCVNTFWVGPIRWALYMSGLATFKAGPWTPWPLIYRAQGMAPIQKVLIQKLLLSLNWNTLPLEVFAYIGYFCLFRIPVYCIMVPRIVLWFYGFGNIFVHFGDIIIIFFAKSSSFYAVSAFRTFRCNPKPTKHHSSGPFIARTTFFRHFFRKNGFSPKPLEIFPIYIFCFITWERHFKLLQTTWYPRLIV